MSKFIEAVKQYKCLYDIQADPASEEIKECWTKLARQMRYSVSRCHKKWIQKLEEYASFLESKDKNPSPMMAAMEFVRDDVLLQIERVKQLCNDDSEPVPATLSATCDDNDDTPEITMKREFLDNTANAVQSMQERPAPQKRARRNAVDDECLFSDTEQETYNYVSTPKRQQTVSSVPPLQHSSTIMTTAANRQTQTTPSVTLSMEDWRHQQLIYNIPPDNNATTPNAHAFGMYVAATLNGFTAKKQMAVRGKIFEMLQQAELEK